MRLYITIAFLWFLPSILWCSTQLPSLPMLPRILSPIVPLYWWCLQSNNYDHDPFMFCAAAFVSSRNALPSFLICCHQELMNSGRSLANRKGSIYAEKGGKEKATSMSPSSCNKSFGNPKTLIGPNNLPSSVTDEIIYSIVRPSIFAATLFPRLQLTN